MSNPDNWLTIGETATRAGIATSTLRFYEQRGLINSIRTSGNQRRYHRATLRRIGVIRVAQSVGLTLEEVLDAFSTLPKSRTPNKSDWAKLSRQWRDQLDGKIQSLQLMRERLSGCIGCGCLSLRACSLYNHEDRINVKGQGPRYLLGDDPI